MAQLPITLHGFPAKVAAFNLLPVGPADLVRAALLVGKPPLAVSLGGRDVIAAPPRHAYLSLVWRALLVRTHLRVQGRRWVRTESYRALDPSEKSAVSYFLGNTQAKLTSELVLGVPHLVHLDALLAALGTPTRRSRPDFIGCDSSGRIVPVAIEAKGRTHGYTDELVTRAKLQAQRVPAIIGLPSPLRVASIAWFDGDEWQARLEDPPSKQPQAAVTQESVVVASYLPVVSAMFQAESLVGAGSFTAHFPEADLTISLPEPVAAALETLATGQMALDGETSAFAVIQDVVGVGGEPPAADQGATRSRYRTEVMDPWTGRGLDGLTVRLGDSWRAVFDSIEP